MRVYIVTTKGYYRNDIISACTALATAKQSLLDHICIDSITDFYFWKPTTIDKKRAYKLQCHESQAHYGGEKTLGAIIVTELIGGAS